ncbi:unnamed protein product [Ectocarpus fasciculatus]
MPPQPDGIPGTSDIPFFSSLHGRERRALRGIARIDLQSAVKYGKKQQASPDRATGARRWRYTHANIVYITDETSTKEITCYAKPNSLPRANLTLEHIRDHEAAKSRLKVDPSLCASHTVIVVDQSGSMRTCDVENFRTRSNAVFGVLAMDFVAKQRLSGEATDRDTVSLILMRNSAEVVFEREPMGLVLYNKFVGLHDQNTPRSHGMFLPALHAAQRLLKRHVHGGCALSFMFLSDGRPSDRRLSSPTRTIADQQDFSVLEAMADAAQAAGAHGMFYRPELSAEGLGTAIAGSSSSLTAVKARLTSLATKDGHPRELRKVERESAGSKWGHDPTMIETGDGWVVYTDEVQRFEFSYEGMRFSRDPWVPAESFSEEANAIALRKRALGEGSERLVFGLQEVSSRTGKFVGPKLVAKESRHVSDDGLKMGFHESFAKTQHTSKLLAAKFNERVRELTSILGIPTTHIWEVSFVDCSVYQFSEGSIIRGVLVEKMLEPACRYTKWNGNNGYVRSAFGPPPVTPDEGEAARQVRVEGMMEVIMEGDEEDGDTISVDSDNGDRSPDEAGAEVVGGGAMATAGSTDEAQAGSSTAVTGGEASVDVGGAAATPSAATGSILGKRKWPSPATTTTDDANGGHGARAHDHAPAHHGLASRSFAPKAECYPQAFSHFSFWQTRRTMLVCDLQGVLSSSGAGEDRAGVFEFTDPVIHYRSKSGRTQVYGKTDLGRSGMNKFFETHRCNDVCRLLGIGE